MNDVMDDISYKEHKLANKAQTFLEYQQEYKKLQKKKIQIREDKPSAGKQQLSYEESIEFGREVDRYHKKLDNIEQQLLKLKRQLSALELQIKKLLPVTGVQVKVSKFSGDNQPRQTFCIKQVAREQTDTDRQIQVQPL